MRRYCHHGMKIGNELKGRQEECGWWLRSIACPLRLESEQAECPAAEKARDNE